MSTPSSSFSGLEIAIIGMSCRFPGASSARTFWENLRAGKECISFFSKDELAAAGVPASLRDDPAYVPASGALSDPEWFDAEFFGFSASEALLMDPQHRLFFECAWEALEDASYNPRTYRGRIGCYGGAGMSLYAGPRMHSYFTHNLLAEGSLLEPLEGPQVIIANRHDYLCTRVSYKLNLRGPSVDVQTACSTSLVALHMACQSVLNGECDMALAGAAALHVPLKAGYLFREGGMFSSDGHCRPFDARADGTVGGNGVGVVLLKRLEEALADRDHIYAVIKGSAINNDGSAKVSYMAPSVSGQAEVVSLAQQVAGVDAETLGYVEAHGTGTAMGDPIEVAALTEAFRQSTAKVGYCALGSVKSNIGHLDTAAGMAGLIKASWAVREGEIPPTLHFERPNPSLELDKSPFYVNAELRPWPTIGGVPRRAAVSALGAGGTNAHLVLEASPPRVRKPARSERPMHLLTLSARTEAALRALAGRFAERLGCAQRQELADLCYSANTGRASFEHRLALPLEAPEPGRALLERFAAGEVPVELALGSVGSAAAASPPKVAFLFTGQGAQYPGMGAALYRTHPVFRRALEQCEELARPLLGTSLLRAILSDADPGASVELDETRLTQPALFALEYALCELWQSWGVRPAAVIGHSLGEYVAACVAGVFSLEDGLALVIERARRMQALPSGGAMQVLFTTEARAREALVGLGAQVSIAGVNAPQSTVISGDAEAVAEVASRFAAEGIRTQPLRVSHAFHSARMEPMLADFERVVAQVRMSEPKLPLVSNVTGEWATADVCTAGYWARHVRAPVRFAQGVQTIASSGIGLFLEVGPKATLLPLAEATLEGEGSFFPSLASGREWPQLLDTLGGLYVRGVGVDWAAFDQHGERWRVPLPTYPFERKRFWVEPPSAPRPSSRAEEGALAELLAPGKREALTSQLQKSAQLGSGELEALPRILDALARLAAPMKASSEAAVREIVWTPAPLPVPLERASTMGAWLIVDESEGWGEPLLSALESRATACVRLQPTGGSLEQRVEEILGALAERRDWRGVVHLAPGSEDAWGEPREEGGDALWRRLAGALATAQAFVRSGAPERCPLWFVASAQSANASCLDVGAVSGLVRTLRLEYVDLEFRHLALDSAGREAAGALVRELTQGTDEDIRFQHGERRLPMLRTRAVGATMVRIHAEGAYLVTGGLGGLGLEVAGWLVEQGARTVLLLGRREPTPSQQRRVEALEAAGARVHVGHLDVADAEALRAWLAGLAAEGIPALRGVIHAAGALADGVVEGQTESRWRQVLAAKALGAWNLHALTRDLSLDFFVLFSSVAGTFGSGGQSNYAAANGFLDALAALRQAQGLAALSVAWGPWDGVGMAAREERGNHRAAGARLRPLGVDEGRGLLGRLLGEHGAVSVMALREDAGELPEPALRGWSRWIWGAGASRSDASGRADSPELTPRARLEAMTERVRAAVAQVLGLPDASALDPQCAFYELGLDSLMGLQLRNVLGTALRVRLPATVLYKHASIAALAAELGRLQTPTAPIAPAPSTPSATATPPASGALEALSEADIARLLSQELGS